MKRNTLLFSVFVHVAVLASLLLASERRIARRRATAIAMMEEKKKEKDKPKEPPRPPPPKVERPKAKAASAEPPKAAPTSAPPPPARGPAPMDSGLTMGNDDGPGIAVGGPRPAAGSDGASGGRPVGPGPKKGGPAPRKTGPKDEEEECQEGATKPELVSTSPSLTDVYSASAARAAGVEGKALFRILVGADGSVMKVEVLRSVDPGLDAACVAAIEKWRFKPGLRCGKPVAGVAYNRAATFELAD